MKGYRHTGSGWRPRITAMSGSRQPIARKAGVPTPKGAGRTRIRAGPGSRMNLSVGLPITMGAGCCCATRVGSGCRGKPGLRRGFPGATTRNTSVGPRSRRKQFMPRTSIMALRWTTTTALVLTVIHSCPSATLMSRFMITAARCRKAPDISVLRSVSRALWSVPAMSIAEDRNPAGSTVASRVR